MKKILLIVFLCGILSAQTFTISGYITDKETGETLIGANIIVQGLSKGASTDNNGYFWVSDLPTGKYSLEVSYIGYKTKHQEITLINKSLVLPEISLEPEQLEHEAIVVTAKRSDLVDVEIETSPLEITQEAIRNIPAAKKDVFRSLKYLPGIEGGEAFSPLYSVRGSDPGENLVLLDGVTIYNPYHFVSGSGLFNVYAIKKAEMLVGGFGAEYGGRNSSVLYITTREGNNTELHGEIEPTLSMTRAVADFPINENATLMISARCYYDLAFRYLFSSPSYFYDTNIALNWKLNDYNRLNVRFFHSKDYLDYSFARYSHYLKSMLDEEDKDILDNYDMIMNTKWNNNAVSFNLKTIINPQIYLQTNFSGSFFSAENNTNYNFEFTNEEENKTIKLAYKTDIHNEIKDLTGISVLDIKVNSVNSVKLGIQYNRYHFGNKMQINFLGEGKVSRNPELISSFIEDKITYGRVALRPGIRYSKFSYMDKWYSEPRFNAIVNLPYNLKLKAAWGEYYQYIISINSQDYELSQFIDYYYPLKSFKPSHSTHYIVGLEKSFTDNFQLSADFYYKNISTVYTFDYNLSEMEIYQFSDKLKQGSGKSYGMELLLKGKLDKFSGWISYSWSKSKRSYPHIMNGKSFMFDYDRTHALKAVVHYNMNPSISFSTTFRLLSGIPKTLESGAKSHFYYNPQTGEYAYYPSYINDVKNNARMPYFLRLDIGMKKRIRKGFASELADFLGADESYLNVTLGNVLFFLHRNVIWYFPIDYDEGAKLYGLGDNYFPEFSIGYTIKF